MNENLDAGGSDQTAADAASQKVNGLTFAVIGIHEIEPYRFNPRTLPNPQYEQIKASIRADGITNTLTVTRSPGATHYSPYGGGNTRLRIARELFEEEGDQRFAQLSVLVKAWPGEAAVISAHLAENENRGDIGFWEKAQGVAMFRREFESAIGRVLTSSELNRELRRLGLNFGIKMVQNFAFVVANLAPIGPWLRAKELNAVLRPAVSSYLDVGDTLRQKNEVERAIAEVLTLHQERLLSVQQRNEERDDSEQLLVELDIGELLTDLQVAVANAFAVAPAIVALMSAALARDPRLDAEDLRRLKPTALPEQATSSSGAQVPLGGMLASVPPQGSAAPPFDQSASASAAPPTSPSLSVHDDDDAEAEPDLLARDLQQIHACFIALNQLVPLHDLLQSVATMPFGFFCDLPDDSLATIDGETVAQPAADYRIVLWKLLVILSGQLNHEVCAALFSATSKLRWIQALALGADGFAQTVLQRAHTAFKDGDIYAGGVEVAMLFSRSDIGPAVVRLLTTLQQFRARHPQRFAADHTPLFSKGPFTA